MLNFVKTRPEVAELLHADGQIVVIDMKKLIFALRSFVKAPKNCTCLIALFILWISSDYKTQPLLQDTTIITRHNHYYKTQPLLQDTSIITRHNHYYKTQPLLQDTTIITRHNHY
jgi:hypothetical protein